MNLAKLKIVLAILKALQPIVWEIVEDLHNAQKEDSDGGEKITAKERQQILINNLLDLPAQLEPLLKELGL